MLDLFATSLNHKLVFFNISWDGLDSLFGPVTLILQVMQVNLLASEGPLPISTCSHSCFEPFLDPALVQDKSLCPVRALRCYLDKTKDLRKGKEILFVAIKEGYSKDLGTESS